MSTKTILFPLIAVIAIGAIAYSTSDAARVWINENAFGIKAETPARPVPPQPWIYMVADPTDLSDNQYAIPEVDTNLIGAALDLQYAHGGGNFWLGYIDRDSRNNSVITFQVSQCKTRPAMTSRRDDESMSEYEERATLFEKTTAQWKQDSTAFDAQYHTDRTAFLMTAHAFLAHKVYVKGPELSRSDVHSALNSAARTMEAAPRSRQVKCYLIPVSDLKDNVKGSAPLSIPSGITVIAVNGAPGSSGQEIDGAREVESGLRALEVIQQDITVTN